MTIEERNKRFHFISINYFRLTDFYKSFSINVAKFGRIAGANMVISSMLFSAIMKGLEKFYSTGDVVPTSSGRLPTSKTLHVR